MTNEEPNMHAETQEALARLVDLCHVQGWALHVDPVVGEAEDGQEPSSAIEGMLMRTLAQRAPSGDVEGFRAYLISRPSGGVEYVARGSTPWRALAGLWAAHQAAQDWPTE